MVHKSYKLKDFFLSTVLNLSKFIFILEIQTGKKIIFFTDDALEILT